MTSEASAEWSPEPRSMMEVISMLRDGSSGSNAAQESAYRRLTELSQHAEFGMYLAFLLTHGVAGGTAEENVILRQSAGLVLKNHLRRSFLTLSPRSREYVKMELLIAVGDELKPIRETTSLAISSIVSQAGLQGWTEALPSLLEYLKSTDASYVAGAISALCKVCEDTMDKLELDPHQPLDSIVPALVAFMRHHDETIRVQVVHCFNQLLLLMPASLESNLAVLLENLFVSATDDSAEVRKGFCGAICKLVETNADVLEPHMQQIIPYMIETCGSSDAELALEATDFWSVFPEGKIEHLKQHVPQIVRVLANNIVYDESDPDLMDAEEDCSVPDRPEDVRLRFHGPKSKGNATAFGLGEEDVPDGHNVEVSHWTLRKSSAAGMDVLSTLTGDVLVTYLLPVVRERLQAADHPLLVESAILALGATSEGCFPGMVQYLPTLIPRLIELTRDPHHLVRSMACWTLSRFSRWIVTPSEQRPSALAEQVLKALLTCVLDRNKRVQETACSALACFEEELGPELVPFLAHVIEVLTLAFQQYQQKNRLILYDAIGTMAECVGRALAQAEYVNVLMEPLTDRWNRLPDNSIDLLPLIECLTVVLRALGPEARHFAPAICARCVAIAENALTRLRADGVQDADELDVEFVICSLDLLAGVAEGLGPDFERVVDVPRVLELLFHSMKEQRADVRQSAFALLGDVAGCGVSSLPGVLSEYMPLIVAGLDIRYHNVCNNATWSLGEVAVMLHATGVPSAFSSGDSWKAALTQLVATIKILHLKRSVLENTAIALGRLGLVCASTLALALGEFVQPMCMLLRDVRDGIEKEQACRGLCTMIKLNPGAVVPFFLFFCDCVASWQQLKPDLQVEFEVILNGYKESLGPNWAPYFESFPEALRRVLIDRYHL